MANNYVYENSTPAYVPPQPQQPPQLPTPYVYTQFNPGQPRQSVVSNQPARQYSYDQSYFTQPSSTPVLKDSVHTSIVHFPENSCHKQKVCNPCHSNHSHSNHCHSHYSHDDPICCAIL